MDGTVKSQGTELYVANTIPTTPQLVKFVCPTGISGLGGTSDQIEDTCLDVTTERTYKRGLATPGQVTVPFNFVPTDASHQLLLDDLKATGDLYEWIILFSDGVSSATLNTAGAIQPPASRTSALFSAYVADVTIDVATNDIVRGTLTLQRSGDVTWTYAA